MADMSGLYANELDDEIPTQWPCPLLGNFFLIWQIGYACGELPSMHCSRDESPTGRQATCIPHEYLSHIRKIITHSCLPY